MTVPRANLVGYMTSSRTVSAPVTAAHAQPPAGGSYPQLNLHVEEPEVFKEAFQPTDRSPLNNLQDSVEQMRMNQNQRLMFYTHAIPRILACADVEVKESPIAGDREEGDCNPDAFSEQCVCPSIHACQSSGKCWPCPGGLVLKGSGQKALELEMRQTQQ